MKKLKWISEGWGRAVAEKPTCHVRLIYINPEYETSHVMWRMATGNATFSPATIYIRYALSSTENIAGNVRCHVERKS